MLVVGSWQLALVSTLGIVLLLVLGHAACAHACVCHSAASDHGSVHGCRATSASCRVHALGWYPHAAHAKTNSKSPRGLLSLVSSSYTCRCPHSCGGPASKPPPHRQHRHRREVALRRPYASAPQPGLHAGRACQIIIIDHHDRMSPTEGHRARRTCAQVQVLTRRVLRRL